MGRPRKYSDELRRRAIDEVLERDRKVPEVAKQLGIAFAGDVAALGGQAGT